MWFPLPKTSTHDCNILDNITTCECGIQFESDQSVLALNLMDPSQQWETVQKSSMYMYASAEVFNAFQKYQIILDEVYNKKLQVKITITNKQNQNFAGHYIHLPEEIKFKHDNVPKHYTCVMIKDDLYVIINYKMIVIQNLDQKIVESEEDNNLSSDFEITIPHLNSTPFVLQDVLFIVGGHDNHCEPFPDIYQFDHSTMSWLMYGRTTVSRYGAKVVVFKGRNEKESVFIAGGYKQSNDPCNVIERIPVEIS